MFNDALISHISRWASTYMDTAYHAGKKPGLEPDGQALFQTLDDELAWFIDRGQMPSTYSSFLGCAGTGYLIVHLTACFWDMSSRQAMRKLQLHVRALLAGPHKEYADYVLATSELPNVFKLMLDRKLLQELGGFIWERAIGVKDDPWTLAETGSGADGDSKPAPSGAPNSAVPDGPEGGAVRILESRRVSGFHDVQPGRLGADWRWSVAGCNNGHSDDLFRRYLLNDPGRSDA